MTVKEYIIHLDSLTTKEFCNEHLLPLPVFTGNVKTSAIAFMQIDAIKLRLITEYAKQYKETTMFSGTSLVQGTWNCKNSPTKRCIYNAVLDPMLDNCIICGEPDERK